MNYQKLCIVCGKKFETENFRIHFCSLECKYQHERERKKQKNIDKPENNEVINTDMAKEIDKIFSEQTKKIDKILTERISTFLKQLSDMDYKIFQTNKEIQALKEKVKKLTEDQKKN